MIMMPEKAGVPASRPVGESYGRLATHHEQELEHGEWVLQAGTMECRQISKYYRWVGTAGRHYRV